MGQREKWVQVGEEASTWLASEALGDVGAGIDWREHLVTLGIDKNRKGGKGIGAKLLNEGAKGGMWKWTPDHREATPPEVTWAEEEQDFGTGTVLVIQGEHRPQEEGPGREG